MCSYLVGLHLCLDNSQMWYIPQFHIWLLKRINEIRATFRLQNLLTDNRNVWFDSLCPINNLSVIKGLVCLGWTSTKLGLMFLLKDTTQWCWWLEPAAPQSWVKHWATGLPMLLDAICTTISHAAHIQNLMK